VTSLKILGIEKCSTTENRQRVKTKVQRLQEYKRLKEIESSLAKERQREHARTAPGTKSLVANLPEVNAPAREKAADTVGLKPRTAEKGLAVLNTAEAGVPAGITVPRGSLYGGNRPAKTRRVERF
jgi:hypothetical protein